MAPNFFFPLGFFVNVICMSLSFPIVFPWTTRSGFKLINWRRKRLIFFRHRLRKVKVDMCMRSRESWACTWAEFEPHTRSWLVVIVVPSHKSLPPTRLFCNFRRPPTGHVPLDEMLFLPGADWSFPFFAYTGCSFSGDRQFNSFTRFSSIDLVHTNELNPQLIFTKYETVLIRKIFVTVVYVKVKLTPNVIVHDKWWFIVNELLQFVF